MKKLSVLIALMLCITISGVYATWTYINVTDVADESVNTAMNLTGVVFSDGYGAYEIDRSTLALKIDPKTGTTHTTSLQVSGEIVIKFTPATFAPLEIKENGVDSTFAFSLSNNNWTFDDDTTDEVAAQKILELNHPEAHDIVWTRQNDGTFTYTLSAKSIAEHLTLSEFVLDTKAKYDSFNSALANGSIIFTVSDGTTTPN